MAANEPGTTVIFNGISPYHAAPYPNGGLVGGTGCFPPAIATPVSFPEDTLIDYGIPGVCPTGHHLLDLHESVDGLVFGFCDRCHVQVTVPRIIGGINWHQAGQLLGEALTVVDDDDFGEMLGSLKTLSDRIDKEIAALERSKKMVKLARTLIAKKTVPIEA